MIPKASVRHPLLRPLALALALVALAAGVTLYLTRGRNAGLPAPGSDAYEQATRHFYRGLAKLEVGLLDDAAKELTQATEIAPGEPAAWANLGLVHLRLGAFDDAAAAIARAAALAPSSSEVAFLQARLETLRGGRDAAIGHLRRAVALDGRNLQAMTALSQEVENAGGAEAGGRLNGCSKTSSSCSPTTSPPSSSGLASPPTRRRVLLQDSLRRLGRFVAEWPPEAAPSTMRRRPPRSRDFSAATRRWRSCATSVSGAGVPDSAARHAARRPRRRAVHPLPAPPLAPPRRRLRTRAWRSRSSRREAGPRPARVARGLARRREQRRRCSSPTGASCVASTRRNRR